MKKILIPASLILAAVFLFATEEQSQTSTSEHRFVSPSDMQWSDAPPGLPAGAQMAVLDGDPGKPGSFTVRLKTSDGYKIMPHTHPTAERVTVISGTIFLGMGDKFQEAGTHEMGAGSFAVMPKNMSHYVWKTTDAVVQIHSEGPFKINYVNPADDPRNAKK